MIKTTLESKLESTSLPANTGQLIKETFVDKLDALCNRFKTNYKKDPERLIKKLIGMFKIIDLEDLGQQLELFRFECKTKYPKESCDWSDAYRCKVLNYIMNYDLRTDQLSCFPDPVVYQSTRVPPRLNKLNPFQHQLLDLYLVDGFTLIELADRYQVHRETIHQWLKEISSLMN